MKRVIKSVSKEEIDELKGYFEGKKGNVSEEEIKENTKQIINNLFKKNNDEKK